MKSHFTTREVAKIVDLPEWRIRSCVRAGFLSPLRGARRQCQFAFHHLLLLRTTKGLVEARVPWKQVRRILHSLKRQLRSDQKLWNLTIYADGQRVVAWDGSARWQPDSGQFLFNFDAREVAHKVDFPTHTRDAKPVTPTAEHWFNLACELEKNSPAEARWAYHQALDLDSTLASAHINLGRLYHQAREFKRAEAHYRAAIRYAPDDALAQFNLGVLLEDCRRPEEAARAYRQALDRNPNLADAHYNLALLFEAEGRRSEAIKHFRQARKLYGPRGRGGNQP
jgi:tetratricopeptide (TPR) repeat protein